jgi:outer membrane protein assembly factor BamB
MRIKVCLIAAVLALLQPCARAADWPMARFDANRSGASPQELAGKLHLEWVRDYPKLEPAWPDQAKMQFDVAYDPVVVGRTMFLGSPRHDWVTALDTVTGAEKWRFFAEGPVRFAPAVWQDKVFFTSDDGYLYCLDAAKGALFWKFRGGPSDRKVLGNERLISTWPARGGPVIAGDTVYFAASIWPFMGIFIHALDAKTGKVVWTNDGDGSLYMKQPHNTEAFAGVAPQGPLAVIGDLLVVPGGRSVPACFDRNTGKFLRYQLAENGKKGGGSDVAAIGNLFCNGGAAFDLKSEKYLGEIGKHVVLTPDVLFTYSAGACRAYDLKNADLKVVETLDRKGKPEKATRWSLEEIASCKTEPAESLIKAGTRLFIGGRGQVQALDLDLEHKAMAAGWRADVDGTVVRLVAAADRLFAVTREGRICCFGRDDVQPTVHALARTAAKSPSDGWAEKAEKILQRTGAREGYCIAWGIGSGRLIWELARQSNLHIVAVDPDAKKVQALCRQRVAEDLPRVFAVHADLASFSPPPYLASLMVAEDLQDAGIEFQADFLSRAFQSLRPYGGVACFLSTETTRTLPDVALKAKLVRAVCREDDGLVTLTREGALPGAGNWTHEHGDAANTRVAPDHLVKAPLGVLWFGGPSHEGILPRHGHGPQPQVMGGRMIIEGVDLIRAIDIYTGRLLWETPLPGVGSFYNNLYHQPGANAAGSNYVCTSDGIFVAHDKKCVVLDPATGKQLHEFTLPKLPGTNGTPRWGYLNVYEDYLVGGADPILDPKLLPPPQKPGDGDDKDPQDKSKPANDNPLVKLAKLLRSFNDNMSASMHLVVMERRTGKVLWTISARSGFRHNGTCIGGGRLYTVDRLSGVQISKLSRRGEEPPFPARLLVLDLKTGKEIWSTQDEVFGTWLSYSAKFDVLVESGRVARDTLTDEPKGMRAYQAKSGKVMWHGKTYVGPAMLHGQTVLQGQGGCDLLSGALKMRVDPITGLETPWTWVRTYGCNTPAASEHLLTFRSGAAGYFDYASDGGTGNFGGFRSSCTNNLIVAGGILTAPEYTRTCTCSYQNQTSLALIHMPEAEMWTYFGTKEIKGPVRRVGINFGGAGDRRAADGTLWLEYPSVAGVSPALNVSTKPANPETFRRHSSSVTGKANWVTCSGMKGIREVSVDVGVTDAPRKFTVRLYFAEPDALKAGQRLFDVALQGRTVATNLDVCAEAGGPRRTLIKEFKGIVPDGTLTVRLTPAAQAEVRSTLLCGLEIAAEGD